MTAVPSLPTSADCEVTFADGPYAPSPTWTDISSRVTAITGTYGRQQMTDKFLAGSGTITCLNADRELDPFNTASIVHADLEPNRRFRVQATDASVTSGVLGGVIQDFPLSYTDPTLTWSVLPFADPLAQLTSTILPDSIYEATVLADAPSSFWTFGETTGTVAKDISGNGNDGTYQIDVSRMTTSSPIFGSSLGAVQCGMNYPKQAAVILPGSAMPHGSTFSLEIWASLQFPSVGGLASFQLVSNDYIDWSLVLEPLGVATAPFVDVFGDQSAHFDATFTGPSDTNTHQYVIVYTHPTVAVYVDGNLQTLLGVLGTITDPAVPSFGSVAGAGDNVALADTDSKVVVSNLSIYQGVALTPTQISAHYEAGTKPWYGDTTGQRIEKILGIIGWDSGRQSIDPGIAVLGSAQWSSNTDALTYLQKVEASEQGQLCYDPIVDELVFLDRTTLLTPGTRAGTIQATFSDDPSQTEPTVVRCNSVVWAKPKMLLFNEVQVNWDGGTVTVQDATSIGKFGTITKTIDTVLRTADDATQVGLFFLDKYSQPVERITALTIDSSTNPARYPVVLPRRIGDRVKVVATPQNSGVQVVYEGNIEGGSTTVNLALGTWSTTFFLRSADGTYFTWDVSVWDGPDPWGP